MKFKDLLFTETLITEGFINLFNKEDKEQYIDEIWDKLQLSYKSIGGIKGSGFNDKNDLINSMKLIKIYKKNNNIEVGFIYKDKNYRKLVAIFTDGSNHSKKILINMLKDDFKRSTIEVSHSLLKFIERNLPYSLKQFAIPSNRVSDIIKKDIIIVDDYKYKRKIGTEYITKMLLGTIKQFNN